MIRRLSSAVVGSSLQFVESQVQIQVTSNKTLQDQSLNSVIIGHWNSTSGVDDTTFFVMGQPKLLSGLYICPHPSYTHPHSFTSHEILHTVRKCQRLKIYNASLLNFSWGLTFSCISSWRVQCRHYTLLHKHDGITTTFKTNLSQSNLVKIQIRKKKFE